VQRSDDLAKRSDAHAKRSDDLAQRSDVHAKRSDDLAKRSDAHAKRSDAHGKRSDDQKKRSDAREKRSNDRKKRSDAAAEWAIIRADRIPSLKMHSAREIVLTAAGAIRLRALFDSIPIFSDPSLARRVRTARDRHRTATRPGLVSRIATSMARLAYRVVCATLHPTMLLLDIFMVVGGLVALIFGADFMIRGISSLATKLGVPAIVIGMTVVAFGTSLPEVAVNVMSAAKEQTDLAFGNIVGSCSINLGWVLAITAIIRPLKVDAIIIRRELPFMILASATFMVMSLDPQLNGPSFLALIPRTDGILLLLLFCVFLYNTTMQTISVRKKDDLVEEATDVAEEIKPLPGWQMTLMIIGGLIGVGAGAHFAVLGAVHIAERFGVPDNIIGLTLISFGTTLPELVTCIIAARRGQAEIAMGNVVGSNILNILFVGGTVATIHPIAIPQGGIGDMAFLTFLCILTLPIAIRGSRTVTRAEGALLLILYLSYTTYRTATSL
jgi:cation:H+ antiporter